MKHDRIRQAGCALCAAAVLGVAASARGAAAADLSPQDRCAIAKLEAASREAACLTDAQIAGIRQGLTDQQVNKQVAACKQREQQSFKNAEGLPGECKTLGDAPAVDYGLRLATDIPRSCGESGPPCHDENPATLTTVTLQNKTPHPIRASVNYSAFPPFCNTLFDNFKPSRIEPEHTGLSSAGACLIRRI